MSDTEQARPAWDEAPAQPMIGAQVLIGMTYVRKSGTIQEQMFGIIISADEHEGFEIRLEGQRAGEIFRLPPHLEAFQIARPGKYRLRSTQELVIDPDFTTTWSVDGPVIH